MNKLDLSFSLPVDTGCIGVADLDFIEENGGGIEHRNSAWLNPYVVIPQMISPLVKIYCENTWNGKIDTEGEIKTNGRLVFGDLCYLFPHLCYLFPHLTPDRTDPWIEFLHKTDYLRKEFPEYIICDTGGDGEFEFFFTLTW
jgi:hypothetical protein